MGELAPGAHVLEVTVSGADGQTASQQIPFTVPEAPAPTARTPIVVQPPVISTETPIPPTATPATPTEVPPTAAATLVPLTFGLRGVELGEVVADGARAVRVTPDEGIEVASVVFTLDGEEIDRDEAAPYVTTINMGELAPGAHVIDIALTAADGQTASQQVPFTVPEVSAQAARTPVVVETPVLSTPTPIPPTATPATPTEEAPTATEVLPTETATEPPPTETPTEVAATAVPQVALGFSFTGLTAGEVIEDETREVEIVPAEGVEIASAAFSLDGTAIGTDDEAPFSAVINTANLEAGVHTFSATVTDANGGSLTQDVEFSIPARTVISDLLLIACGTLLLFLLIAAALVVSRRRRS
jgi:methionine-rich copper-binding protein CopC